MNAGHAEERPRQKEKAQVGFAALAPQKSQAVANQTNQERGVENKEKRLLIPP